MARQSWKIKSIAIARQTALATENTTDASFGVFPAEVEVPELSRQIFDNMIATGKIGVNYAPAVGAIRGKIKLKFPAFGFKRGYAPATEEPGVTAGVISANAVLMGLALGSASDSITSDAEFLKGFGLSFSNFTAGFAATFANNTVAAATSALQIDVQAGEGVDYKPGQLVTFGSSATDNQNSVSWIKTISTDTIVFADAMSAAAQVNDDSFGTICAFNSSQQPVPFTLRLLGDNAGFKMAMVGCTIDSCKITPNASEPPMIEMEISAAGVTEYSTGGGTLPLTVTPTLPYPMLGNYGGRSTIGYNGAAMSAVNGLRDLSIEIANNWVDILGHGSQTGIAERICLGRDIKVNFKIPTSSADTKTNGEDFWDTYLTSANPIAMALYGGALPGTGFSVFMPALHQSEEPKMVEVDGLIHREITLRPGDYTGDTGTTGIADSALRVGWY